jgi:hypothetical protein
VAFDSVLSVRVSYAPVSRKAPVKEPKYGYAQHIYYKDIR